MLRSPTLIAYIPGMKTKYLDLYTDYLISTTGYARATELWAMLDGEMSHDQVIPIFNINSN